MPRSHHRSDNSQPSEVKSDLTPWLEQARRELESLRVGREVDPWESNLLSILGDILSTAEDAIGSFRVNNWERLFAFLERIQEKAHQGIEHLSTRV